MDPVGEITREKGGATERNYGYQGFPHKQGGELEDNIENLQVITKVFLRMNRDCHWSSGGQYGD